MGTLMRLRPLLASMTFALSRSTCCMDSRYRRLLRDFRHDGLVLRDQLKFETIGLALRACDAHRRGMALRTRALMRSSLARASGTT